MTSAFNIKHCCMKEACVKHTWVKAIQAPGVYSMLPESLSHDLHGDGIVSCLLSINPLGVGMCCLVAVIRLLGQNAAVCWGFDGSPCPCFATVVQLHLVSWAYERRRGHNALRIPITIG